MEKSIDGINVVVIFFKTEIFDSNSISGTSIFLISLTRLLSTKSFLSFNNTNSVTISFNPIFKLILLLTE